MLQTVSGCQAAHATAHNHHVMSSPSRRPREYLATFVADLVAELVVFAFHARSMVFLRVGGLRFLARDQSDNPRSLLLRRQI